MLIKNLLLQYGHILIEAKKVENEFYGNSHDKINKLIRLKISTVISEVQF